MVNENDLINARIKQNSLNEEEFFALEISDWLASSSRNDMLTGKKYYLGEHDIKERKRTAIGRSGEVEEVSNLPNNIVVDNRYARLVDQKKNYILGKAVTFKCNDDEYYLHLKKILDNRFMRSLKLAGEEAIIGGIAWIYPYVDDYGELKFKVFSGEEVCPFWKDSLHTELDCAVRVYELERYEGKEKRTVTMVDVYKVSGVTSYEMDNDTLVKQDNERPYLSIGGLGYNWQYLPLIPIKANAKEIPLINKVKQLQDSLNLLLSDFVNNMEENVRNSILVLKNYDGTDLGEFRKNLSCYGAIKTRTQEGSSGGVDVLRIEVNSDNYEMIIKMISRAITQNARGFEARDEGISISAQNQISIRSIYSDIDLDANDMENELQASFMQILQFVNIYLQLVEYVDTTGKTAEIIFNRDILINETELIENCIKSQEIISRETVVAHHPWVDDINAELVKS